MPRFQGVPVDNNSDGEASARQTVIDVFPPKDAPDPEGDKKPRFKGIPVEGGAPAPATPDKQPTAPADEAVADFPAMAEKALKSMHPEAARDAITKRMDELLGRDPEADYKSGLPHNIKVEWLQSDNEKERQAVLDNYYPGAKLTKDKGGKLLIQLPNGKKIEPEGAGFWRNLGAETEANALPLAFGMTGGALGGLAGGSAAGPPGVAGGAMAGFAEGQMLGKSAQEWGKYFGNRYRKTPSQEISQMGQEAGEGFVTEAGGRVFDGVINKIWGGYPFGLPFLPQPNREMSKRVMERGMSPPFVTSIPGSKILQQKQSYLEKVVGSSRQHYNSAAAKAGAADILARSGVSDTQINDVLDAAMRGEVDLKTLGEKATKYFTDYIGSLEKTSKAYSEEATKGLDQQFAEINKAIGSTDKEASEQVVKDIKDAKDNFSRTASGLYGIVDEFAGNKPILNTIPLKRGLNEIMSDIAVTKDGKLVLPEKATQYIKDLQDLPDYISFKQAQGLRSQILSASYTGELTQDLGEYRLSKIGDAVDSMFANARQGKYMASGQKENGKKAAQALENADKFYADNINKFKDVDVARLAKDATKGGAVRPEDVVKYVADPRYASKTAKILSMLSPDGKVAVAKGDLARMVDASTDDLTQKISGKKLFAQISLRKDTAPLLFGKKQAKEIEDYARRLSALDDDKIAPDVLKGDSSEIASKLRMAAQIREQTKDLLGKDNNYLSALAKPGFNHDEALDLIIKPGQEHRLQKAMDFFRGTPVEGEIKKAFAMRLLSKMADKQKLWERFFAGGSDVNAASFKKEVDNYSEKQLKMIFGEENGKDLKRFAEDLDFSMGQNLGNTAASLAAGAAKMKISIFNPSTIPFALKLMLTEYLITRPGFVRWLVLGVKPGAGAEALKQIFREGTDEFLEHNRKDIEDYDRKAMANKPQQP